jgi:hypothetical protein
VKSFNPRPGTQEPYVVRSASFAGTGRGALQEFTALSLGPLTMPRGKEHKR